MAGRRRLLLLLSVIALFGPQGCGVRVGPLGLGAPVVYSKQNVRISSEQWSPDSRCILIWRHTATTDIHDPMLIVSLTWLVPGLGYALAHGDALGHASYDDEILRVKLSGWRRTRKIAEGSYPTVCPAGSYVAYRSAGNLWLADYESGARWLVAGNAEDYSFSPDGKWLLWRTREGPLCVVDVREPRARQVLGAELQQAPWAGTRIQGVQWGFDGSVYCTAQHGSGKRWLRFAPPAWALEDLGDTLTEEHCAGLVAEPPHPSKTTVIRLREAPRSPDGTMVLRRRQETFSRPDLLILPKREVSADNLDVVMPDGSVRELTSFGHLW